MESGSREEGEVGENYATLHMILQSKKCKEATANNNKVETGLKMGSRKFKPP